jgi:SAM-dependent methyltransferase
MSQHTGDTTPVPLRPEPGVSAVAPRRDAGREALRSWLSEPAGQRLVAREQQLIRAHLGNLFGYNLLQVGALPGADLLASSRVLHRTLMDLGDGGPLPPCDSVLRGSASALPVGSSCVDVVVLPHVVEFEPRPHEALREAARVLIPDGYLLLSSFNPWSLLGLWRVALRHTGQPPWDGHFLTLRRLKDWLELLDFDLVNASPMFFEPPLSGNRLLRHLLVCEPAARHLCPLLGGCQLVLARKRIANVTPIRPRLGYRRRLVGVSLAGPPARVVNRTRVAPDD